MSLALFIFEHVGLHVLIMWSRIAASYTLHAIAIFALLLPPFLFYRVHILAFLPHRFRIVVDP